MIAGIGDWWSGLQAVNQWFYAAAGFFSIFFLWQLVAAVIGLGGDSSDVVTTDVDVSGAHGPGDHLAATDAAATMDIFKLLSIRSILAFLTMFTWACALYLNNGVAMTWAVLYGVIWGLVGMFLVALLMFGMRKMAETGNPQIATCVGTEGTVYMNIPPGGEGEVRVAISGVVTLVKARGNGGQEIKAGSPVKVLKVVAPNKVEVEPVNPAPPKSAS
ncbi:MAG: hypothetical protein HZA50_04785 [Planctomycetes bacterium]|nr:hypothetical protein [Planctomycetota bacterium]